MQAGYVYYRIRQVDKNGNASVSDIQKLLVSNREVAFGIISNPIRGNELQIRIDAEDNNKGTITVLN
ncbi:hypothetical protein SAE01_46410 [Segetibacter aerophilus]|uniref:Uncharacterized protein n=1 Tax=Segetibacter aerophilus TaxID=670293 RepID=A0A512BJT1_9BACT|nr:hypothetical protein SAE01_46410 [Segetibacter aerophilus]